MTALFRFSDDDWLKVQEALEAGIRLRGQRGKALPADSWEAVSDGRVREAIERRIEIWRWLGGKRGKRTLKACVRTGHALAELRDALNDWPMPYFLNSEKEVAPGLLKLIVTPGLQEIVAEITTVTAAVLGGSTRYQFPELRQWANYHPAARYSRNYHRDMLVRGLLDFWKNWGEIRRPSSQNGATGPLVRFLIAACAGAGVKLPPNVAGALIKKRKKFPAIELTLKIFDDFSIDVRERDQQRPEKLAEIERQGMVKIF